MEPPPTNGFGNGQDVDSLTAGVRKLNIKLKVPSPEENAMRERVAAEQRKSAAEERKKATSRASRKLTGSKPTKTPVAKPAAKALPLAESQKQNSSPEISDHPSEGMQAEDASVTEAEAVELSGSQVVSSPTSSVTWEAAQVETQPPTAELPAMVKEERPAPMLEAGQQSVTLAISPPLTPRPPEAVESPQTPGQLPVASMGQAKYKLPIFTSTGPIPFASAMAHEARQSAQSDTTAAPPQSQPQDHAENDLGQYIAD
jgi:histone deacetylase HOS3